MQDIDSNQSEPAAERQSGPPLNGRPVLTDVASDRDMYNTPVLVAVIIACALAGAVLGIFLATLSFTPNVRQPAFVTAVIAIGALVWAMVLKKRNTSLERVRQTLEESADSPIETRIKQILTLTRSLYPQVLVREAVKALAAEGRFGSAIRIAPRVEAARIDPIAVPFEPRRFDEVAEVEFVEPRQTETETDNDGGAQSSRGRATSPAVPRGIRRNLILKGGWILVVILGLSWLARAIESLQRRIVTAQFMLMTVVMLAFLLVPVGHSWLTGRQWLAVPGGIVLRKGKWLKRRWDLHLFGRGGSVLVVYKLHRRQWALAVADREACESVMGTKQELEAVLRAWLSPLAPPTLEQLSDLR